MTIETATAKSGISHVESEILLARLLKKERTWIMTHGNEKLSEDDEKKFMEWIDRRKKGEPIAYITNVQEFFGRHFYVDQRVLIPRPSTEGLIELALDFLKTEKEEIRDIDEEIIAVSKKFGDLQDVTTIIDIGTGSGCIAITLALERPDLKIIATDISSDALDVAKKNATDHHVLDRFEFLQGNLLDPLKDLKEPFVIVSNPPYIPSGRTLMNEVQDFEPHLALFSGDSGTDTLRLIVKGATGHPQCKGIALECEKSMVRYVRGDTP